MTSNATPPAGQQGSQQPGQQQQRPYQTKLVLLGPAAVGKSSVVLRFVSNEFQENKEPTIGAAFLTVCIPPCPPSPLCEEPVTDDEGSSLFYHSKNVDWTLQ